MFRTKTVVMGAIVLLLVLAACTPADELRLTRQDQAEIIRLTLERALIDQEIPDYALIKDPQNIVLSLTNIDATLVPELQDINLVALTSEEIQAKADSGGDFLYLEFTEIKAQSQTKVMVSLNNAWAVAEGSKVGYLSGGGFTVEYSRTEVGWVSEIITTWMS
jgi:hypothetical protein